MLIVEAFVSVCSIAENANAYTIWSRPVVYVATHGELVSAYRREQEYLRYCCGCFGRLHQYLVKIVDRGTHVFV